MAERIVAIITKLRNKPFSTEALRAGFPLVNNRFTPDIFIRAAKRAGLRAKLDKRPLKKITDMMLPAVLLLNDGQMIGIKR